MGYKTVGRKTVRAFSMPNLILYNMTDRGWVLCSDFQGCYRQAGPYVQFCIRSVDIATLNLEVEEVLPLSVEILDYSQKASIRMFVREILDITDRTPQVHIIMSDYDEDVNPLTLE